MAQSHSDFSWLGGTGDSYSHQYIQHAGREQCRAIPAISDVASLKTGSILLKTRLMIPISFLTPGSDLPGGAITSKEGGRSEGSVLGSRDLMNANSVGVYEDMYTSERYFLVLSCDGIAPIAWRGREQNTEVGHHQTRDCSGIFNSRGLSITIN
jgi:hypothetical protein